MILQIKWGLMKLTLLVAAFFSFSVFAESKEQKIFTVEKSHNSQNKMMIHALTDSNCKFIVSPKNAEKNYFEFYWMMNNESSVKEVHPKIRSEIKNRFHFGEINERKDLFRVKINDLSEVNHDIPNSTMEVTSEITGGKCVVKSMLALGASGKYRKMDIARIYCVVSRNMFGIPNGCKSILLEGSDPENEETFKVRFYK